MWTLGSMQWQDLYLVDTLASVGQEHLPEFSGQALANTAWAFAQLELKDIPLLDAIAANALEMLKIFKSQELATSAWTFGNCTDLYESLLEAIADEADLRIAGGSMDAASSSMLLEVLRPKRAEQILEALQRHGRLQPLHIPGLGPLLSQAEGVEGADGLEKELRLLCSLAKSYAALEGPLLFAALFRCLRLGDQEQAQDLWHKVISRGDARLVEVGGCSWSFQQLLDVSEPKSSACLAIELWDIVLSVPWCVHTLSHRPALLPDFLLVFVDGLEEQPELFVLPVIWGAFEGPIIMKNEMMNASLNSFGMQPGCFG
ncbi:Hypothetical protein SCF082_LOCUS44576 [Durusdinium trenchii]|uniref:Uncharacterized protein n=1 Tax=Durusdinium trenchii TaxID=1381693 RepID=A0ABP0R3R7_9DINO